MPGILPWEHRAALSGPFKNRTVKKQMSNRSDCLSLFQNQLPQTGGWRLKLSKKYPDDMRNARAARRLYDLANEIIEIPDHIWDLIEPHYHWSSEKLMAAVSQTNRDVVVRNPTPDTDSYWNNLSQNIALEFANEAA